MDLKEFDFNLPTEYIARFPTKNRGGSKLMVVDRINQSITHHQFCDIPSYLKPEDFLVVNNTKVVPARLFGEINHRSVEMLVVKHLSSSTIEALTLPAKHFKEDALIKFESGVTGTVKGIGARGRRIISLNKEIDTVLKQGFAPLPPYIKRKIEEAVKHKQLDLDRYQTIYSQHSGSIAAPTAGLHFTDSIMKKIKDTMTVLEVTLNVGEATFQTITVDDITTHRMGTEQITITHDSRAQLEKLKKNHSLVAVGTTSVRSLETYAWEKPSQEDFTSDLFIYPGYQFQIVDKLITNFHLPKSSLFILVCAFAGTQLMKQAYRLAIKHNYRFFSYGDAMLII